MDEVAPMDRFSSVEHRSANSNASIQHLPEIVKESDKAIISGKVGQFLIFCLIGKKRVDYRSCISFKKKPIDQREIRD